MWWLVSGALAADDGRSLVVVPGAFWSQETTLGLALFGAATARMPGVGEDTWPSSLAAAAVGTFRRQASLTVWPSLYLGEHNTWVATGSATLAHFPTRWYGVGPSTDGQWQDFTRRWVRSEVSAQRRVAGDLYVGVADGLSVTALSDLGSSSLPDPLGSGVPGETGGVAHGVGPIVRWDARDNPQSTRQGALAAAQGLGYGRALGSRYGFTEAELDLRAFHTPTSGWATGVTFAGQLVTELRAGEVPVAHLAELGGDNVLRGLYQGRFRDRSVVAGQVELRVPIAGRFRAAGWGGVGQVFGTAADLVST
ncbi:MAG: hypothetical protein ABMA64_41740, partial [Myxococcota bacterium]